MKLSFTRVRDSVKRLWSKPIEHAESGPKVISHARPVVANQTKTADEIIHFGGRKLMRPVRPFNFTKYVANPNQRRVVVL